ncbi:MAG TPA: aminotransferase class III-fold pyridoxal phosphate-dependent enzyme [Conexibacter sp.]|nr:aminotransferase class III-fold pyridoxal phosphate-dependent enzyme [Conexibacter sp.]
MDARGSRITFEDGRTALDLADSPGLLGHRHPRLVARMRAAVEQPALGESHATREREEAAQELLSFAFAEEPWAAGVRFCTTASEAIDIALALAQSLSGRSPLVVRECAYHGPVGLAREASTLAPLRGGLAAADGGWTLPPRGAELRTLPAPACAALGEPAGDCHADALAGADALLDGAAAAVMDYGSGAVYPCAAYQDELARRTRAAGALWLQDEAITGLGRTARWFAFQRGAERPDLVALGKGLTGGYAPGGALVLSAELIERLEGTRWMTFSTWRGHTLTVAAISETLRTIHEEQLLARAAQLGERLAARLRELLAAHPCLARVSGEGLVWNLELRGPADQAFARWDGAVAQPGPAQLLRDAALARGLFLRPIGPLGLWLFSPMTIEDDDLETALAILDESLSTLDERVAS